jgi:SPP1 family phage portal protein
METEYQASFEDLLWFVDNHLANIGAGDYEMTDVDVIFNRDMLLNEGEVIDNVSKSVGILSDETVVSMHPWVDDPQAELERIKAEKEEKIQEFGFNPMVQNQGGQNPDEIGQEGGKEGAGDE